MASVASGSKMTDLAQAKIDDLNDMTYLRLDDVLRQIFGQSERQMFDQTDFIKSCTRGPDRDYTGYVRWLMYLNRLNFDVDGVRKECRPNEVLRAAITRQPELNELDPDDWEWRYFEWIRSKHHALPDDNDKGKDLESPGNGASPGLNFDMPYFQFFYEKFLEFVKDNAPFQYPAELWEKFYINIRKTLQQPENSQYRLYWRQTSYGWTKGDLHEAIQNSGLPVYFNLFNTSSGEQVRMPLVYPMSLKLNLLIVYKLLDDIATGKIKPSDFELSSAESSLGPPLGPPLGDFPSATSSSPSVPTNEKPKIPPLAPYTPPTIDKTTIWDDPSLILAARQANPLLPLDHRHQIRLATYNVHNWSSKESFTNYNEQIVNDIINIDADIIGLQEVVTHFRQKYKHIQRKLEQRGYVFRLICKAETIPPAPGRDKRKGEKPKLQNFILYKEDQFELISRSAKIVQFGGQKERCFIVANLLIKSTGQIISVICGHLSTVNLYQNQINETKALLEFATQNGNLKNTFILLDMNNDITNDQREPHKLLRNAGFVNSFTRVQKHLPEYTNYQGKDVSDYIYIHNQNDMLALNSVPYYTDASDHLPIVLDIELSLLSPVQLIRLNHSIVHPIEKDFFFNRSGSDLVKEAVLGPCKFMNDHPKPNPQQKNLSDQDKKLLEIYEYIESKQKCVSDPSQSDIFKLQAQMLQIIPHEIWETLESYGGGEYRDINKLLRGLGDYKKYKDVAKIRYVLDELANRSDLPIRVYRGMKPDIDLYQYQPETNNYKFVKMSDLVVGDVFVDYAFISSSLDIEVPIKDPNFYDSRTACCLMTFILPPQMPFISTYLPADVPRQFPFGWKERELILPGPMHFRIIDRLSTKYKSSQINLNICELVVPEIPELNLSGLKDSLNRARTEAGTAIDSAIAFQYRYNVQKPLRNNFILKESTVTKIEHYYNWLIKAVADNLTEQDEIKQKAEADAKTATQPAQGLPDDDDYTGVQPQVQSVASSIELAPSVETSVP